MNVTCQDRERILFDGSSEEWAALERHALFCPGCEAELRAWKALSLAAAELRDYREDPALWAKIESSLRKQEPHGDFPRVVKERLRFWAGASQAWQTALVGALLLLLSLSGVYLLTPPNRPGAEQNTFLKSSALAEVERTEQQYREAIDRLAADAKPELDRPVSPLLASYREKLLVLDSAIDDLRVEAGRNPSNAHLRYQLLALYQEKQETLREVLETKP